MRRPGGKVLVMRTTCLFVTLLLAACGDPSTGTPDVDAGVDPDAGERPDAAAGAWVREREGDGRRIVAMAAAGDRLVAVGDGALVLRRAPEGTWSTPVEPQLEALLDGYAEPRGQWTGVTLTDEGVITVAGALGFYVGGAMEWDGRDWRIVYDETVHTPPLVAGGPVSVVRGSSLDTELIFPTGPVVQRTVAGWFVSGEDHGSYLTGAAIMGNNDYGVGLAIWARVFGVWQPHRALPEDGDILRAVVGLGERGVAVGDRGLVVELPDGAFERPTTVNLAAVDGRALDDVWAVGAEGTVLRRTAAGWSPVPGPPGAPGLTAIVVHADAVWVGAEDGAIHRLER
jgi:hypothetical protein